MKVNLNNKLKTRQKSILKLLESGAKFIPEVRLKVKGKEN